MAKLADFRGFYCNLRRALFVSVLCVVSGFMSAWAAEYPKITYYNQYSERIDDLVPDEYTEAGLSREELPNSDAVSAATGCTLEGDEWYWDDKMSESVESIEPEPFEDRFLYGNLSCDENRIVTLNPVGEEEIGSDGTRKLYYYRKLGDYGEFFYNEYNGSKSAARLASTIILPTYDTEKYTFLGYYSDPEDLETQCVDERGYITEYGFQQMAEGGEGETSWDAVYEERSVADAYTVSYNCGNHGSGSPGSQSANAYSSVNLHLANVCTPDSGYELVGWSCYSSSANPNTEIMAAGESMYVANDWDCTALWVDSCPNSGAHVSILDDYLGQTANLVSNTFSTYITVTTGSMCSSTPGAYLGQSQVQTPAAGTEYCWCHITALGNTGVSSYSPWVFISGGVGYGCTSSTCNDACVRYSNSFGFVRESLTDACAYNLSYTCGELAGSVTPQSETVFYNETVNLPQYANGCTYVSGASFLGWDCHVSGNSNGYSLTMPDNNVICDALWDAPDYTLTYNCGGNGTEPASVTQNGGSNVQLANGCNAPLSSNYDFQGWYCVQGNHMTGDAYHGGDTYILYFNTTCTAIWTESNPCDPGAVERQVVLGTYDSDVFNWSEQLQPNFNNWTWTLEEYGTVSLAGMCSSTPGMYGVPGIPASSTNSANDTYCWCRAESFTTTEGESISLDNNSWVYSGFASVGCDDYTCQGWCAGEYETIEGWREFFLPGLFISNICNYTLTYDCDNGNNSQSALNGGHYQGGQSLGLWANGGNCTAPTNQTFDYWTCDNGTVNNNVVNPTPYDNMTCTAHWKNLPTYTLTYNCNNGTAGGTAPVDGDSPYYAGTTGITLESDEGNCNPPSNMVFSRWNCHRENSNSTPYTQGDEMPEYNVVCDAQWTQKTYTVTYHGGCNANDQSASYTVNAGDNYTVENPGCALSDTITNWLPTDGCSQFIGWSTSQYNSSQTASEQLNYGNCSCQPTGSCGTIINVSSNIDLYAICDDVQHNVIYHNCKGEIAYTDESVVYQGITYTPLSPSDFSIDIDPLSSFQGWATAENAKWCSFPSDGLYPYLYGRHGDNKEYTYTNSEGCKDVDLYAVCCPLNLKWDLNGGAWPTGSSGNQATCEYSASAGAAGSIGYGQTPLQTPTRTGYTFKGWQVTGYATP